MEKRYKAQVSVEMLAIVGVVILGALVFASYYLSSVNRNIDTLEGLDPDFSKLLPNDPSGTFPGLPGFPGGGGPNPLLCGNNVINTGEQCDGINLNGQTCIGLGFGAGSLTCNLNCTFNASGCSGYSAACGNNILEEFEECEMNNETDPSSPMYSGNPSCTAYCIDNELGMTGSGNISCNSNSCSVDYSACVCSNTYFKPFLLILSEDSGSANQNIGFPTNLSVDFDSTGAGTKSLWVDVNVTVKISGFYSDKCKYDNTPIPATQNGLFIKKFLSAESNVNYIKDISCSADGVYIFIFKGVDNLNNISDDDLFEFTVPLQDSLFFCDAVTTTDGSLDVCINRYEGGATAASGEVAFFINQPDVSEFTGESCITTNGLGEVCFSLGFN